MSVKIMGGVWELELDPPKKLVLLAMADHADHEGKKVHPSVALVAWKTGYSPRQVQRIIHDLTDAGVLEVQHLGTGRGNPTHYHVVLEKGVKLSPFRPEEGRHPDTLSGEAKGRQIVTHSHKKGRQSVTLSPLKGDIHESERVTSDEVKGDIAMSPEPSLTEPSVRTEKGENPLSPQTPAPSPVPSEVKPSRTKPRGTVVPVDFLVTEELRQFGESIGLTGADLDAETAKFIDHFRGTGGLKVDWIATWRNWMRRAVEDRRSRPAPRGAARAVAGPSRAELTRALAAKLRAEGR